ncbi:MAG: polyprenyl diphosphate synthase [Peptoniphilaceae bacterium]|nr:polyprenyl diphosphate synthase [Peptoniphilaceae bacterium]MDY6085551.1 polyprenyl diphosphate synthase [Peptoniphilaceae bacterium]
MSEHPKHVGIILDGNGRWATKRGLKRTAGHEAGTRRVLDIARAAADEGIEVLSLYAFSTENWKRSAEEVSALMRLLVTFIESSLDELIARHAKLRVMGDISRLPLVTRKAVEMAMARTAQNDRLILNVGLNYGGRCELVRAFSRAMKAGETPETLDEQALGRYLDTADLPDLDLLIRTGGEQRISNFMLWQVAYTEIYFTPVLWPDFDREAFHEALTWYEKRDRRFGGV